MEHIKKFINSIYLGDRYCEKIEIKDDKISFQINCISRLKEGTKEWNYYSDEDIEEILASMRRAKDTDTLYSAVGEYARVFCMNPPFVPMFYRTESVVYTKKLSGVSNPTFYNRYDGMEKWYFKADGVKGTD